MRCLLEKRKDRRKYLNSPEVSTQIVSSSNMNDPEFVWLQS
ncbi:hypothetical protein E2C01_077691 [Portunus trituberculatus]|uniref:Uncharacterized protein n=1 Tax=Portunus trituberculatus TaxID=210409 RepID=A0A5B7IGN5_PORTR|nr:hypothetical protein [Portunus trituberculatus]